LKVWVLVIRRLVLLSILHLRTIWLSLVRSVGGERRRTRSMGLVLKLPFIMKERAGTRD
jgi:hypothetical protein